MHGRGRCHKEIYCAPFRLNKARRQPAIRCLIANLRPLSSTRLATTMVDLYTEVSQNRIVINLRRSLADRAVNS